MTTDHPQHSTNRRPIEPRIITTRRMITTGKRKAPDESTASAFVIAAATSLQAAALRPLQLQPAPARGNVQTLLSNAGQKAQSFRPRAPQPPTAA